MKHIKMLNTKYHFIQHGDDILVTNFKNGDQLLSCILEKLEDKIITFTNDLESKLNALYEDIREKCSNIFNEVSKVPSTTTPDKEFILYTLESISEIKAISTDSIEKIIDNLDDSLTEIVDDDIHFLKFNSFLAKEHGDIQEAIKIQELTHKRLHQLTSLVRELCCNTEQKVNEQLISVLDLVDHKFKVFNAIARSFNIDGYEDEVDDTDLEIEDIKSIKNDNVRIPRTSLELKRHLKKEGFELHRHHGSHQIYKNDEGEVRLVPARRGNHVLAAKTAKKIYQGVSAQAQ